MRAGWNSKTVIRELIGHDGFAWPSDWYENYPTINSIQLPLLGDMTDQYGWKKENEVTLGFSVHNAWDSFRPRSVKVSWYDVVWFSQGIPKHSFLLWLVIGERLKTQDKLKPWDIRYGSNSLCAFCKGCPDSHPHLFFNCPFSVLVWNMMQQMVLLNVCSNDWRVIVDHISPLASRNLAHILVFKLCLAATIYGLWHKRNCRIFKKVFQTEKQVFDAIVSNVRLKLITILFKQLPNVARIRDTWKLHVL
ncbi:uncharacterized protein [Rutidosis leptorrhynchoides]|uniref:uncharacterized protein n=1 Tax=Rutidosis leptorrhynchoides TaxID=125765 RepID=UPI003A990F07